MEEGKQISRINKNKKYEKNKNKNHFNVKNIIIHQLDDEKQFQNMNGFDIPQNKIHKRGMKSSDFLEMDEDINKNYLKEDYNRKDDKNGKKKVNYKKSNNKSNISNENKNLNKVKKIKLKNLINKLYYLYYINILNKYFQRWILQTFDIIEEDSEGANDNEDIKNKPNITKKQDEEEEEEEEENDYGGDLEEIEERAPDEEESVITSVQSKTRIKRTNNILFALRKIFKYKNIFFRYFIRWYNAVDLKAPTNEYKKIRKEKKLSNNITNIKKNITNINSNINNNNIIELKNPIYELSSEEKVDEIKSDVKANLKNIIELKGTKKSILKKYYDIWYILTFKPENYSFDSNNNEQNEFIFTYHGNYKENDLERKIQPEKQKFTKGNINDNKNINKNKEVEGYNKKTQKNIDYGNMPKKSNKKAQCYVKKKINSIKKEGENGVIKKVNKKKNKINDFLKNLFIKINNKKLLNSALKKWMKKDLSIKNLPKVFKKKVSPKAKKKTSNIKNAKKSQIGNSKSKDNESSKEEKTHKKNSLSLDEYINQKEKIKNLMEDNKMKPNEEFQVSSESSPKIALKKNYNGNNPFQLNSDNSVNNSINTNTNTSEMIDQLKEREFAKKGRKSGRNDESKKLNKIKEKNIQQVEGESLDIDKIKQYIEKISRIHKNNRAQRYLLIKPPKIKKKKEKKKEDRQSFSTINLSLKLEKIQKRLIKLFLKTTCRQNPLMTSFDRWFNKTFNSQNYIPFMKTSSFSNDVQGSSKRIVTKVKKIKKTTKSNDKKEAIKKRDISVDNINLNMSKKNKKNLNLNQISTNTLDSYENDGTKNEFTINRENKANKNGNKLEKNKDILNQDIDLEPSNNKLLFNEKNKISNLKSTSESFDTQMKKQKSNIKDKGKSKESKDIKKKVIKKGEKIEEGPRQRKPGNKKVQLSSDSNSNNENIYSESTSKKHINDDNIYYKNTTFDIDNNENSVSSKDTGEMKRKKHVLSYSFDVVILEKKSKKVNNLHIRTKSKDDNNRKINHTGMNGYFVYNGNHQKDEEINPEIQNIEIIQEDDSNTDKKHKKMKKNKKTTGFDKEKNEDKRKEKLIKIYNRACHLLRKAIRSYKKRNKIFDPEYELFRTFQKWVTIVFNNNEHIEQNEHNENNANNENNEPNENNNNNNESNEHKEPIENKEHRELKNELKDKELEIKKLEDTKEKKVNFLKNVLNNINSRSKKIKGRLSEDEENYNYIKWCYNIWFNYTFDSKEEEEHDEISNNNMHSLIKDNMKNNVNSENKYSEEPENSENKYSIRNSLNDTENLNSNLEVNKVDKKEKEDKKENSKNEKKKKKYIEPESLLDIDLEDKKIKKHKSKKKKLSRNLNSNNINSLNSSSKKDSSEFENNLKEDLNEKLKKNLNNIIAYDKSKNDKEENEEKEEKEKDDIKNGSKNIQKKEKGFANKNFNDKNNKVENNKRENKNIQKENFKEISKKEENIFQKIKKEFPMNDGFNINTEYIKDTEDKDIKEEEENPGVPKKIQAPPQVLALMKKQGKKNLPLPSNNLRISYREFGKGNLEVVEPGELVSSERLKIVKQNLKRNLTCNSDKFSNLTTSVNSGPLTQSSYFRNDAFNLNSDITPKTQKEINKKLVPILEKKDEGLFDKKKYFKTWGTRSNNLKPHEFNLNIRPQVKKLNNSPPVVFLTKSIEKNNKDGRNNINEDDEKENNKNIDIINEDKKNILNNKIKENNNENVKNENNRRINRNEINRANRNVINNRIINIENKKDGKENEKAKIKENDEMIKIEVNYDEEIPTNIKNINNIDKKEINPKERENNIKNIYKLTKEINRANNNIFNIINKFPFYNINTSDYTNLLNNQNRNLKAYQLYLFYTLFNDNYNYFLKKNSFYKWKRGNKIFKDALNKNHIKLYDEHCISCTCDNDKYLAGQTVCLNCNCDKIKNTLKNVLINYKFLKELNPIRYYFYLWYKNIFF